MANTTLVSSPVRDVNAISTAVDATARSTVRSSRKQIGYEVTGNPLRWKEFQAMQPSLYLNQEGRVLLQVTNQPGTSGLAGVIGKKLINFVHV